MLSSILDFIKRNGEAGFALISLALLSFIVGAAFDFFKIFPAPSLQHGFLAAEAIRERFLEGEPEFQSNIWHTTPHAGRGVTKLDEDRAYPGLTLYTSADAQRAYLIDLQGNVVHEWHKTFREVWPDPPHVPSVVPPQNITYRRVLVLGNGDLLVVADGVGSTPYGYGLFKLDKNSDVIWRYAEPVHHDVDVGDDGKIYTLIHYNESALPDDGRVRNIETPFIDDYLVVLSADGQELERVNLTQALLNSPYGHLLRREKERPDDRRDPLHNNTVKVLSEEMALVHTYGKPGQVLLSMKSLHLVALVDVELEQIVWATWALGARSTIRVS